MQIHNEKENLSLFYYLNKHNLQQIHNFALGKKTSMQRLLHRGFFWFFRHEKKVLIQWKYMNY